MACPFTAPHITRGRGRTVHQECMQAAVCELRAAPETEFAGLAYPCCVSDRKDSSGVPGQQPVFLPQIKNPGGSEEGFSPAIGEGEPLHFWTVSL